MTEPRSLAERTTSKMNRESKTKQSERDAANINTIIAQYRSTGTLNRVNEQTPLYGDFTQAQDLQSQLHRTMEAQARFDALPSALRNAADNDPVKFLEMTNDDDGLTLLIELGLVMVPDLDQAEATPSQPPAPAPPEPPTPPVTGGE